jgi:hypothetical protein
MYEPKYKLNRRDDLRWRELVARECLESTNGRNPKFPPLTRREKIELERLSRKRSRKIMSHPRLQESLCFQRNHSRKLKRLLKKLEALVGTIKAKP